MPGVTNSREYEQTFTRAGYKLFFSFSMLLGIVFGVTYLWHNYAGPYDTIVDELRIKQEKAALYLSSPTCRDSDLRAKLENYNKCEESHMLLQQNVYRLAFHQLMDDLQWCRNGVCMIWGVNITENVYFFWYLIKYSIIVVFAALVYNIVASLFTRQTSWGQLPITNNGAMMQQSFLAGFAAAQMHNQCQQPPISSSHSMQASQFASAKPMLEIPEVYRSYDYTSHVKAD